MCNKWRPLVVLCAVICLVSGCGSSQNAEKPADESHNNVVYHASSEKLVYIEFDKCYTADNVRISLTPASAKDTSNEIPLTYYPSINGCMLTLEEGSYCIEMDAPDVDASTQSRYFVVDETHSYYHIRFTPTICKQG